MKTHYTRQQLVDALRAVGVAPGDILFGHSNIGFFGIPENTAGTEQVCQLVYSAFQEVLGEDGTLIVPTFTYSFPKNEVFDPDLTHGNCGVFSEWIRKCPDARRTSHPCISVAAIGARSKEITRDVPRNGYAAGSFFDRFFKANGKICNMNFDAASTFVHYVERCEGVPYRFDKTFNGNLCQAGRVIPTSCTIAVRYLSSDYTEPEFGHFDRLATGRGLYKHAEVGRGFVGLISAVDTYELIRETLPERPWFLTRAEAAGVVPELIPEETEA